MQPKFATIDSFVQISGIGRTRIYHLLGAGELRAIKVGKRTLVDVEHGLAWLARRPAAVIHCAGPLARTAA